MAITHARVRPFLDPCDLGLQFALSGTKCKVQVTGMKQQASVVVRELSVHPHDVKSLRCAKSLAFVAQVKMNESLHLV
jgi:hypothetical protein